MEDLWRIKERADDLWVAVNLNNQGSKVRAPYRLTPASSRRESRTTNRIQNIDVLAVARNITHKREISQCQNPSFMKAITGTYIYANIA